MSRSRRVVVDNGNAWLMRAYYYADGHATTDGTVDHGNSDYVVFSASPDDSRDEPFTVNPGLFYNLTSTFQNFVVWAKGVVSFGAPTAEQIAFMDKATDKTDLGQFPGQFIEAGYVNPLVSDIYVGIRDPATAAPFAAFTTIQLGTRTITIFDDHINLSDGTVVVDLGTGVRLTTNDPVGGTFRLPGLLLVNGTAGDDTINGTAAPQTIHGLNGKDTIIAGDGATDMFGDAGDDTLTGGKGRDNIYGGAGNDTIRGNYGDTINGDNGNDTLYAENGMRVRGGAGIDRLVLDFSNHSTPVNIALPGGSSGVIDSIATSYSDIERIEIIGSSSNDMFRGTAVADKINGGAGADIIDGGAGNDELDSGIGGIAPEGPVTAISSDQANPVSIDDAFSAVPGASPQATINFDVPTYSDAYYFYSFDVAEGAHLTAYGITLNLYDPNSNFVADNSSGVLDIDNLAAGRYTIEFISIGSPPVFDGPGSDTYYPTSNSISLSSAQVPNRKDTLTGGTGDDTFLVHQDTDQVIEKAGEGTDTVIADLSWTLADNVENLTLKPGSAASYGIGNALANVITGNEKDNILNGGDGNDTLIGGAGDDDLRGDPGADRMLGGIGNDTYRVSNSADLVIEKAGEGTADQVFANISYTLTDNVENLTLIGTADLDGTGNALANILVGNAGKNVLDGKAGIDKMLGGAGADTYYVDDSADRVFETTTTASQQDAGGIDTVISSVNYTLDAPGRQFVENLVLSGTGMLNGAGNALANQIEGNAGNNILSGNDGADTLVGFGGNDRLNGGLGNDRLSGGDGNDRLEPGGGKDSMLGGKGADTFAFNKAAVSDAGTIADADIITDFNHAEGDRIDLSMIDTKPLVAGDQAFTFIGAARFSGSGGEVRISPSSTATFVVGDINGDGIADFFIKLAPGLNLTAADFVL